MSIQGFATCTLTYAGTPISYPCVSSTVGGGAPTYIPSSNDPCAYWSPELSSILGPCPSNFYTIPSISIPSYVAPTLGPTKTQKSTTHTAYSTDPSIEASITSSPSLPSSSAEALASQPSNKGLSTGAKAGIGVGAAIGAIILFLIAFFLGRRRSRAKTQFNAQTANAPTAPYIPYNNANAPTMMGPGPTGMGMMELDGMQKVGVNQGAYPVAHELEPLMVTKPEGFGHIPPGPGFANPQDPVQIAPAELGAYR